MPHMAVLQFPGPDGVRPGTLAERAGMSKQAMNQLLRSLEESRLYRPVRRSRMRAARVLSALPNADTPHTRRSIDILRDIEREWSAELGPKRLRSAQRNARSRVGQPVDPLAAGFHHRLQTDESGLRSTRS